MRARHRRPRSIRVVSATARAIVVALTLGTPARAARAQRTAVAHPAAAAVPYSVVAARAKYRIVLVRPTNRTERAMRTLGDELRRDFSAEPLIIVSVFDNAKAARMAFAMADAGGSLGDDADAFYDKHLIGNYAKNMNTGSHEYHILLRGAGGAQIDVRY